MTDGPGAAYDLIVIGAGAAGSTAASEARGQGARVAMAERWKVGGTCLNAGCDPTKALVRAARALHETRVADRYGITVADAGFDWAAVIDRVERVIDTIRGGDGDRNIREAGIDLRKGARPPALAARGRGRGRLCCVGRRSSWRPGRGRSSRRFRVCARPGFITNVEAVALPALPRSLAIIGGGTIAIEFAQIFARFGVEVTVLGRNRRSCRRRNRSWSIMLRDVLARKGCASKPASTCRAGLRAWRPQADRGPSRRQPRSRSRPRRSWSPPGARRMWKDLGLEAAGVVYDATGIVVDAALRTTAPTGLGDRRLRRRRAALHLPGGPPGPGGRPQRAGGTAGAGGDHRDRAHRGLHRPRAGPGRADRGAGRRGGPRGSRRDRADARSGAGRHHRRDGGRDEAGGRRRDRAHCWAAACWPPAAASSWARSRWRCAWGSPAGAIADTLHAYPTFSEGVFWTAWELAKPKAVGYEATRGVEAPRGDVEALDEMKVMGS